MAFKLLSKVLSGTGIAEPLSATSISAAQIFIEIKRASDHLIEVGDSTVTVGKGKELLAPAANVSLANFGMAGTGVGNVIDLMNVYIIGTAGDGVNVLYEVF